MRYEDTPGLYGRESGGSTVGAIECEWCGVVYNQDNEDGEGEIIDFDGPSVGFTRFGGKQVCDCCFEKVERAVLSDMDDILPWYRRIIGKGIRKIREAEKNIVETENVLWQVSAKKDGS